MNYGIGRTALYIGTAAILMCGISPVAAQDSVTEARMRKAEAEIRALQRKVFPGGDAKYFAPEITGAAPSVNAQNTPPPTVTTDIYRRLDGVEAQISILTQQTEQNTNALAQLAARLAALESGTNPQAGAPSASVKAPAAPASTAPSAAAPKVAPQPAPNAQRVAAVSQIAKPVTDDPGDDEYSYGFRLWEAKFYPEAQQQLTLFVNAYANHSRISYGRNLLGRAYLDDGKANEAASWFLKNYQTDKFGARAADSLFYLGEAMIALKDTKRACIALAEFAETYPAVASGRLSNDYQAALKKVTCK